MGKYTEARECPPGLWYKVKLDRSHTPNILLSGEKTSILSKDEKTILAEEKKNIMLAEGKEWSEEDKKLFEKKLFETVAHDHYFKKNGKWWVQVKTSIDNPLTIDEKGHLFGTPERGDDGQIIFDEQTGKPRISVHSMEFEMYNMGEHLDRMWERFTGELTNEGLWPPSE